MVVMVICLHRRHSSSSKRSVIIVTNTIYQFNSSIFPSRMISPTIRDRGSPTITVMKHSKKSHHPHPQQLRWMSPFLSLPPPPSLLTPIHPLRMREQNQSLKWKPPQHITLKIMNRHQTRMMTLQTFKRMFIVAGSRRMKRKITIKSKINRIDQVRDGALFRNDRRGIVIIYLCNSPTIHFWGRIMTRGKVYLMILMMRMRRI
mmetsp:Transcript_7392/g.12549  ORF Transcript_7392/g.12549 Transcript_7392/m.12549 type:complete len:203 (-) Transcript_7392:1928-2536(-)